MTRSQHNTAEELDALLDVLLQAHPVVSPAVADTNAAGDDSLLRDLLSAPLITSTFQPARLYSTTEQRRIALSPFRFKNWVDRSLLVAERGLAVAVVLFFLYWFVDGYGRDWWHMYQQSRTGSGEDVSAVLAAEAQPTTTLSEAVASLQAPLPYISDELASSGEQSDYLVPQAAVPLPAARDPRPQRLLMPSIGVDTPIKEVFVENGAWQVAEYAAGYHHGTALPGQNGNTVMAGHAGLRGAVFAALGNLSIGDEVTVETGDWRYRYRVREVKAVWPTQVSVMDPTATPVLTLITCTNWDTQRLIVIADLVDARPLT